MTTMGINFRHPGFIRQAGLGVLALLVAGAGVLTLRPAPIPATAPPPTTRHAELAARYGRLPLRFEVNHGQADARVKYLARGLGYGLYLTGDEAVLHLRQSSPGGQENRSPLSPGEVTTTTGDKDAVLRACLVGANHAPEVQGEDLLPGRSNYFIGNDKSKWHTDIAQYAKVRYRDIYPGIDLVYYGNQRRLEYDFAVAPGADPNRIRLAYAGADRLSLDPHGDLHIAVSGGKLVQHKPKVYQTVNGRKTAVDGSFELIRQGASTQVAFALGSYDHSRPLIIDPVLVYSTYLGGSADFEGANAIAVDNNGNAYVAGFTASTDFPTANPLQPTNAGGVAGSPGDAFVAKLSADGRSLVYSTYLGGSRGDAARGIAVDASGNAYVVGDTASDDFPTANPLQANRKVAAGNEFAPDAFIAKLNADGSALVYSTYLGGSGVESGNAIAVDSGGDVYIAGNTNSTDFPTVNPFQSELKVATDPLHTLDGFVAKLDAGGSALLYSTYLGGSDLDGIQSIAVDSSGDAYVAGGTFSDDFPTVNPLQATKAGIRSSAFVAKLDAAGSAPLYSTYLGGNGSDFDGAVGIAVDGGGNAYVLGETSATDFPTTANALQPDNAGGFDAFVSKLNSDGSALVYSTYLGSSGDDSPAAIAVDPSGNAYVLGATATSDFPTVNPLQANLAGGNDAFIARLNADGSALTFSTFLGGSGDDVGNAVAVDTGGNIYIVGTTDSTDFPTVNPLQAHNAGGHDAIVAKIDPNGNGGGGDSGGGSVGWSLLAGLLGLAALRAVGRWSSRIRH
ncbi:MAG: SBBP repeat-containing protein [Gammaproteobacteria bacterium]|nr:SBBP repeat-containing protein [Gammaproteobacteria bacterium]